MSENLRGKATLPFSLTLVGAPSDAEKIRGHTRDMRATGLSLIVPDIRINDEEFIGEDRTLLIILELPTGPVEMQVVPVRYERLNEEMAGETYLVGARITEISDSDCVRFVKYLRTLR